MADESALVAAAREGVVLVGDYGPGAYGPTIMLRALTIDGVRRLRQLFEELIDGAASVVLTDEPSFRIKGLRRLVLSRRDSSSARRIVQVGDGDFEWSSTVDEWDESAQLLDPFLEGRAGHQYLTTEGVDDALVEVSFDEPDVKVPGSD